MDTLHLLLSGCCKRGTILCNEMMKNHTSFRIGGPAKYFIIPADTAELAALTGFMKNNEIEYNVLGNGSNLLVSDSGFDGVIIQVKNNFSDITVEGERVRAGAGALLSKTSAVCAGASLEGFEFASGIPGTLGGAVIMNAGAYGSEMKDVLEEVTVCKPGEGIEIVKASELELGYRTSIFAKNDWIVLEAVLKLNKGSEKLIREKIDDLKARRVEKQPIELPSAGSAFKRPEGYFAGKLIEDAGLKGYSVGDAQVSEKHAGFIVNKGNASASDVKKLYEYIIKTVEDKFGVTLEPEVKFLGDF